MTTLGFKVKREDSEEIHRNARTPPFAEFPWQQLLKERPPLCNKMSSARGQMRARMNHNHLLLHINPPLPHSSLSANHFLRLTFVSFIHPFIPAHSLRMFTAEWFNPFLLIISPHSSGFYIHIFTCLFSSRSAINLGSFCERDLFPSTP